MVPMSFSRAGWPAQLRAETQQVLLWPEENDARFLIFPQVFFSKKHAFYMRSLMSKGTCMVRPRAWRLVSSRKHWSAAPTANTQQPERSPSSPAARASVSDEPSSEKQRDAREAVLSRKGALSERGLRQP